MRCVSRVCSACVVTGAGGAALHGGAAIPLPIGSITPLALSTAAAIAAAAQSAPLVRTVKNGQGRGE